MRESSSELGFGVGHKVIMLLTVPVPESINRAENRLEVQEPSSQVWAGPKIAQKVTVVVHARHCESEVSMNILR